MNKDASRIEQKILIIWRNLAWTGINEWTGYCTTLTVPTATKVRGSDERQTRASCQPFVRANIKQPRNDAIKWINWTTFSPIPSSNFVRSLWQKKNSTTYEKYTAVCHRCCCISWLTTCLTTTLLTLGGHVKISPEIFTVVEHTDSWFCAKLFQLLI